MSSCISKWKGPRNASRLVGFPLPQKRLAMNGVEFALFISLQRMGQTPTLKLLKRGRPLMFAWRVIFEGAASRPSASIMPFFSPK